jgi:hypothetical protein
VALIKIIKFISTNDRGYRIGESHHNSKLTDKEVEEIRDLHEFGNMPYRFIAREYGVCKTIVAEICRYEKRCQTAVDWKKVVVYCHATEEETV